MTEIDYQGKRFVSFKALFDAHAASGITYSCFMSRVNAGWDLAKALREPQNKNTRRTFLVDGKTFKTLRALAKAAGISYEAAVKRTHRGFTDYEIFHGKVGSKAGQSLSPALDVKLTRRRGTSVTVAGIEYPNILAAHDAIRPDISINSVRARLRYGWSAEEALGVVHRPDGRTVGPGVKQVPIGNELLSAREISMRFNVPYSTVYTRLLRGATGEQAAGLAPIAEGELITQSSIPRKPKGQVQQQRYEIDGKIFHSINALAAEYGLSYGLVYNRIRAGWDAEKAVKEPVADQVEVGGVVYRSAHGAWQKIGQTSHPVYNARRAQGLPLEVCLGLAPLPSAQRYEIHGQVFPTLSDVAEFYKLSVGQLQSRLKDMSLEEAIVYTPANGRYTLKRFEEDPELALAKGSLYFIKIASSEGMLHKVGITQRSVDSRFQSQHFELIAEFKGELGKLFIVEQAILKLYKKNLYRGDEDFDGRTETFVLMKEEESAMLAEIERRVGDLNNVSTS